MLPCLSRKRYQAHNGNCRALKIRTKSILLAVSAETSMLEQVRDDVPAYEVTNHICVAHDNLVRVLGLIWWRSVDVFSEGALDPWPIFVYLFGKILGVEPRLKDGIFQTIPAYVVFGRPVVVGFGFIRRSFL